MDLVTYHQFCWNFHVTLWGLLLIGVPSVGWIFLVYVWGFKKDSFTLVVASRSLLGRWVEHLKFCLFLRNGGVLPG